MRKVIFAINATADGFYSHTDMVADDDLHQYFTNILKNADQILYGRTTYQLMVPFWPNIAKDKSMSKVSNEFAKVFTSLEKILFTRTLKQTEDPNTRIAKDPLIDEIVVLKEKQGKDICIGSLSLASQLSEANLIDEYRFVIHPVVAGNGPRLFENHNLEKSVSLHFVSSEKFPSGAMALHYKKQGRL
ncbi:Dihydrofolate reductase [Leptospira biflexa serovar Patoc strain 'Patoc 1 (Ames)']|uniref:Putative dihydrofolate reductase n=1 Tax=Leptospira biflexa serovar Patoc (strain Patoc 1 / ATCC 23582 / Paris) TaxID=456481 RepID=B0SNP7_LEPBP|nr:dihydrofolate reductase family protein [Leptospira biflexa]ABZ93692.1 Dihydrofolate reductase [Leptospira biflexa serovar Patoc strain 'Patoc 1 (Ames)']ABZ97328.1 Putative dihydrofolate reductase [Leptospira biflexa serovar Patoc strain 'Patoc 1 (Paris)']